MTTENSLQASNKVLMSPCPTLVPEVNEELYNGGRYYQLMSTSGLFWGNRTLVYK